MKRIAHAMLATCAPLALAACGSSDSASESATADTVEMPAEEAMSEATGMPTDMATGMATDAPTAMASDAMASPSTAP